jgi:hypothetical protein
MILCRLIPGIHRPGIESAGRVDHLHLVARHFHQERARNRPPPHAAEVARHGVAELQFVFCTGNADERQPPLFFQFIRVLPNTLVRQHAIFDGNNKHHREL